MNRYRFIGSEESELIKIVIGMKFTNRNGNIAIVRERLPRDQWLVEFKNPINGKVISEKVPKNIMLKQLSECIKSDSMVKVTYE